MRVQGTNSTVAGPLGTLPVPVPLREDGAFQQVLERTGRIQAANGALTAHGPLVLTEAVAVSPEATMPVPRLDANRAYTRVSQTPNADRSTPGRNLSIRT